MKILKFILGGSSRIPVMQVSVGYCGVRSKPGGNVRKMEERRELRRLNRKLIMYKKNL